MMGKKKEKNFTCPGMTRRQFLRIGGAGFGAAALSTVLGCTRPERGEVSIVFACGPDDSGTLRPLVEAFNKASRGSISVVWREMDRESDRYFSHLAAEFKEGRAVADVIAADAVWTAPLADKGWVQDLSGWFHDVYDPVDFLEAPLRSAAYRFQIWGVPWYTDAGMLFYRKDMLDSAGYTKPPATWEDLKRMAADVKENTGIPYGFVFQGSDYEGGTANALEYIWNAGGRVMTLNLSVMGEIGQNMTDPNIITVDSEASAQGLAIARSMVTEKIAPEAVADFHESECLEAFLEGKAVFMRNWPNAFRAVADSRRSAIRPEQTGLAPIPVAVGQDRSYSCIGGWNLMIRKGTDPAVRKASQTFIRFLTAPEQQRQRAVRGGFLPTLRGLYEDPEILRQAPAMALGREAILNGRVRPVSPAYMEMSYRIARALQSVLRGMPPRTAVRGLAEELRQIMREYR